MMIWAKSVPQSHTYELILSRQLNTSIHSRCGEISYTLHSPDLMLANLLCIQESENSPQRKKISGYQERKEECNYECFCWLLDANFRKMQNVCCSLGHLFWRKIEKFSSYFMCISSYSVNPRTILFDQEYTHTYTLLVKKKQICSTEKITLKYVDWTQYNEN